MKQQEFNFQLFQVAEIELTYQSNVEASKRPVISSSSAAYDLMSAIWQNDYSKEKQQFNIILLNRANRSLGVIELSVNDLLKAVNYQKIVYIECLKKNAVSIILGHYCPKDQEHFSIDEAKITKELKCAGSLLDINVLDCIVFTGREYTSLADQGLL
jgi:DNA repair protein RadC